jgi:hypothetical protein
VGWQLFPNFGLGFSRRSLRLVRVEVCWYLFFFPLHCVIRNHWSGGMVRDALLFSWVGLVTIGWI